MRCSRVARPFRGQDIMICQGGWRRSKLRQVSVTTSLDYGSLGSFTVVGGNFPVDISVPEDVFVNHEAGWRGLAGSLVVPNGSGLDWGPSSFQPRPQTPDFDDQHETLEENCYRRGRGPAIGDHRRFCRASERQERRHGAKRQGAAAGVSVCSERLGRDQAEDLRQYWR